MKAVLRCLAQVGMVFGGLFIYWGINWLVTGDPMTYLTIRRRTGISSPARSGFDGEHRQLPDFHLRG
ncbi:MAG: hypothetical protein ACLUMK_11875 [Christensenellales bacterium]